MFTKVLTHEQLAAIRFDLENGRATFRQGWQLTEESHNELQTQLAEARADLRAVLTVLTAIPAHRDYDAHFGKALARPGVRRLLAAKEEEADDEK